MQKSIWLPAARTIKDINSQSCVRLRLQGGTYFPDSFVLMLCYCKNLKAIRYESTNFNRIAADKSHRVID